MRDWAVGQAGAGCFSWAALFSNDSKTRHSLYHHRYPLVDGTFFLSPRQYNKSCVQVKYEGKVHYLTAVCMGCLEAWPGHAVLCRSCLKPWAGGHLILGTMYSYDIFAAMPCCAERLKVRSSAHI